MMKLQNRLAPKVMNQRITLGFGMAAVLIASGFAISLYSYYQYSEDTKRVQHSHAVISSLDNILSLLKDVEVGAQGYIITSDSTHLSPYKATLSKLPGKMNQLRKITVDNSVQISRVGELDRLINNKLALTRRRIEGNRTSQPQKLALSQEGKQQMLLLRQHVAMMIETERSLMENRNRLADRSFRNTFTLIGLVSLLTCLALATSYRMLENELKKRQQTEDQLRSYEARLREQIRQLEASNEDLERFAFVASHDLQEPLRKIQSFAELITGRYGNLFDGDSLVFMNKITNSAERMSKLIKDLLNFSRISNHNQEWTPVSLPAVIQRILDDQELRIKGMGVRVEVGELPTIEAVGSQMDHLFANLISNALKFTRSGAEPLLRIQSRPTPASQYPDLLPQQRYFEIMVEDNGIGFDEKYVDHIFKVFQRLHGRTEFEGTGIGLAICKRVVVYHQGFITARSQPNQGTTFIIILPESQLLQSYEPFNSPKVYSHTIG